MKTGYVKKPLAVTIILLFFSVSVIPSTGTRDVKQITMPTLNGDTLYVGGNGTGNYSKIQDAIDDASDGDTVFVYDDSSPYYENVVVGKSITLKGENKETTVINGSGGKIVVNITADGVTVCDFTIKNYEIQNNNYSYYLINIQSDYNIIANNIFKGNASYGIYIFDGEYNNFSNNIINDNISGGIFGIYCNYTSIFNNYISGINSGILLHFANKNKIVGNTIKYCYDGIFLGATSNNYIYGNVITNNEFSGISSVFISDNNTITMNDISYNEAFGIILSHSHNDKITQNNFIKNRRNAYFFHSQLIILLITKDMGSKPFIPKIFWNENYWDNWIGFGPKLIFGRRGLLGKIPWINFDWHPAQEPYDIGV